VKPNTLDTIILEPKSDFYCFPVALAAFLTSEWRFVRRQNEIVAHIKSINGYVMFFSDEPGLFNKIESTIARWAGFENFQRVAAVFLQGSNLRDDDLSCMRELTDLDVLVLRDTGIGDRGCLNLVPLERLTTLDLHHTRITDATIQTISRMSRLESLDISHTSVTDGAVPELGKLKHLRELRLTETGITDGGLRELMVRLPNTDINPGWQ
jgi:hypothetical protein